MKIEIKHRYTGEVLHAVEVNTLFEAVQKLVKSHANLSGANLSRANLSGANLSGANLSRANLYGADLYGADLYGADLYGADLSGANLSRANLYGADLYGADLYGADLYGADLSGANLSGANHAELAKAMTVILPEGQIIGWKKCVNEHGDKVILKISIPADASRSNATGRKCRAAFVDILERFGEGDKTYSIRRESRIEYKTGERVTCHKWDTDRFNECSGGIHFFITREEAEEYEL